MGRAPPFKMHYPRDGAPAGLRLTDRGVSVGETHRESTRRRRVPAANAAEAVPGVGGPTPQKNTITAKCDTREINIGEICAPAARSRLKSLTEKYLLTSLHLLDRYDTRNYSCVYILSRCLRAEKRQNNFLKENILGWGKDSDSPVSRSDNADRKTMKSLQANPECQPLNATSVLPALNYHIFLLYLCSALSASACLWLGK